MDDEKPELSRRVFIHRLTFLGGGVVLLGGAGCKKSEPLAAPPPPATATAPATGAPTARKTFTREEFAVLSAACERIIPRDEDPGALDAGVPGYIDRMLQSPELEKMKDDFIAGTAALDRRAKRLSGGKGFAQATPEQQDAALTAFKDSPAASGESKYYDLLLTLTLEGLLGDPSYGGNKERAGWALVGFGTAEPPVGYDGLEHLHHHTHRPGLHTPRATPPPGAQGGGGH